MKRRATRWSALIATVLTASAGTLAPAPTAVAIAPPIVEPAPPPSGPVAPPIPTELKALCGIETGLLPATDLTKQTSAEAMLEYRAAWRFSRGAGQKVAVIDTGVNPHPRLRALEAGGDYVSNSDGLQDCDAHGTLVAGIIAAAPSPDDSFAGVAPDAVILSIRQNSGVFGPVGGAAGSDDDPNAVSPGFGDTRTLALAITHAVDLGATVINLSEVACAPVASGLDDVSLGHAVRYAYERNVVVVAAAGNYNTQSMCRTQNTIVDANQPLETAWRTVSTIASPAWFDDYVLTVAAVTTSARPAEFSLRGPWVAVAAPGEHVTSLDANGPGVINAQLGPDGLAPLNGTSFAAPFVSGLVALVRSRFPQLTAAEVIDLVKTTARTPGSGPDLAAGYGVIDPVAALTHHVPPGRGVPSADHGTPINLPAQPDTGNERARGTVLAVTAASLAAMAAAVALAAAARRGRRP